MTGIVGYRGALLAGGAPPPGGAGHRYWRLYITATASGSAWAGINEMELRGTIGGADLCTSGTASASTEYSAGYNAAKAFDNSNSSFWSANGSAKPQWLKYTFPSPVEIAELGILMDAGNSNEAPTHFVLEYSDDDVSWTPALTVSGATGWVLGTMRTWVVATTFSQCAIALAPSWYCRHNEASGTTAVNEVGDDGTYSGTVGYRAAALYSGGLECWDTLGTSHVEIPASVLPSPAQQITLGILLKRKTDSGTQAMIDRDDEIGGNRLWQWRFVNDGMQWIKVVGGVETANYGSVVDEETSLLVVRVASAGAIQLFKNGASVGSATHSVADFGTSAVGLRIGRRIQGDSQASMQVAESLVFPRALSNGQIQQLAKLAGF